MFYDNYASLCREKGIAPSKAAEEIGINKASVTNWKKNGYTPRADVLQRIADYFGVTTDYLLGNVSEPYFYLDNERIKRELNSYGDETEKAPAIQTDSGPIHLEGTYLRLARGAQELGLDDEDVDAILAIYAKHKQKNQ